MAQDELFNFEKLIVYQKALDYIDFSYDLTESLPSHERFNLISQFRRASSSIALNIAEDLVVQKGVPQFFTHCLKINRRVPRLYHYRTSKKIHYNRNKYIFKKKTF